MAKAAYTHVTLVVDPEFGQRAIAQADIGPLWAIKSPVNTPVINDLWASGNSPFADSPTLFDAIPERSAEDSAIVTIGSVHDHHPNWRIFEIIGVPLSKPLLDALHECAPGSAKETATGLIFSRTGTEQT